MKKARVIVISGPTAVGKTRLALALAHKLQGEIVSADSVQVYRGLDVGSAKTPATQRQGVPHHLIDIVDPTDDYTAGAFCDDARRITREVISRGRVPIVVGGTGLYLRWYLNGKPGTPKETPDITALVDAQLSLHEAAGDWDAAVKVLEEAGDTLSALSLSRNDWYRLRRALAIIKATGLPRSHFPRNDTQPAGGETGEFEFLCYFLHNRRIDLYRAIDERCEEMLAAGGFLAEASWLLDLGVKPGSNPASRAIGYRQALDFLSECRCAGGTTTEEGFLAFLNSFQQASRNYAKRQLTWFRGEPSFQWIDASKPVVRIADSYGGGSLTLRVQDKIVGYMVEEYHKPAGASVESCVRIMAQSISKREHALMNAYVTENKIFVSTSACSPLVEWVHKTQQQAKAEAA